ncbi:MAG: pre-peptidase C-terminal domain-containing protein [Paracoccaceae bacterium]
MAKDTLAGTSAESTRSAVKFAAVTESGDAANSSATTARISVNDTYTGTISSAGDSDWVAITLTAGQTYVFTAYGSGGAGGLFDTQLYLRNPSGVQVAFNEDAEAAGGNYFSMIRYTAPSTGTYYLDVRGYQDGFTQETGRYTLRSSTDVFTIEQVASQLTDMGWGGATSPLRFNVVAGGTLTVNLVGLTVEGQDVARMALETWSAYTGLQFVETGSSAANIVFDDFAAGFGSGNYAFAGPGNYNPQTGLYTSASVTISTHWLLDYGTTYGSYGYQTYLHEIGHALGLGHAGFYDGNAHYGSKNHYRNDSYQMSIMSYFDMVANRFVTATNFVPITPMVADIFAMQSLYGTSGTVFTGNTVWGANSNVTGRLGTAMGVLFDGAAAPVWMDVSLPYGFTIADSNGIDTMDFSKTTTAQLIDMREGGISNVYGMVGTVLVASGTVIENAVGGDGADRIYGTAGNNFITAGAGHDLVDAGMGDDTVDLGSGNDTVYSGAGNDSILGGDGNDELWGGLGDDTLSGDNGSDRIGGAAGNDLIFGGVGKDFIWAGTGNDTVWGGAGDDEITGGPGHDSLRGGVGNDTIFGVTENDIVFGEDGDDILWAGAGADTVYGGEGNDTIYAGAGDDVVFGGNGADTFVFYRNNGTTRIDDFDAMQGDRVQLAQWLWTGQHGALTPEQVENMFGSVDASGNVTLTFAAAGTAIIVAGLTDLESLDQYISIIS